MSQAKGFAWSACFIDVDFPSLYTLWNISTNFHQLERATNPGLKPTSIISWLLNLEKVISPP